MGAECSNVGLARRECTRMSSRDSILPYVVMGRFGQMLCSCGSFSMICQLSRTDLENCLPFNEYGVTTGMADLGLDAFGVLWRRVSREWRRALDMLQVITSKGYFLARRDIVRELSSFCSMLSIAMKRLY